MGRMKTMLHIAIAAAWLAAGTAAAQADGAERPMPAEPGVGRPAHGHAPRSLRQDLMQTASPPADMPAPHMRMTPEELRQLRHDIHEANREFMRRERRGRGW